jgi:predicted deacylase
MTVLSPPSNWPSLDLSVTSNVSSSPPALVHTGCDHESRFSGVVVLGADPEAGARVLVEEAGVVAVGAEVSVASDTDPQAITASMIAIQNVIRNL